MLVITRGYPPVFSNGHCDFYQINELRGFSSHGTDYLQGATKRGVISSMGCWKIHQYWVHGQFPDFFAMEMFITPEKPSGKHTKNDGNSPFLMGKSTN